MFVRNKLAFSLSIACVLPACLMFMDFEIDMAMINSNGYSCRFVIPFDHVRIIHVSLCLAAHPTVG